MKGSLLFSIAAPLVCWAFVEIGIPMVAERWPEPWSNLDVFAGTGASIAIGVALLLFVRAFFTGRWHLAFFDLIYAAGLFVVRQKISS